MRNIFLWLVIKAVSAFNLTCPHPGQWNYTAEAKNCSITNYICLLADIVADVELEITEDCRPGPRRERKGFKTELNKGNFNRKNCSSKHFQPFKFSSLKNSRCVFEKSNCSEEGQVSSDNGTSIRDVRCRCNYLKGYAFLANTSNLCSCIPSEEDCTCFKKSCSDTEILSPDYNCIDETKPQGTYQCSSISDEELKPVTNVTPVGSVPIVYDKVYRYVAASCCTILVVVSVLVLIYFWRSRRPNKIFIEDLVDQNCFQGDPVTFTCEVKQENIEGIWSKDGNELKPSESINITVDGRIHKLVLKSSITYDSGNYSCQIKDENSSAQLIVKEVIILNDLEDQNCFQGDPVTLTCEVKQENIEGIWSKDGKEIKPSESINITVEGRIHKLEFKSVTTYDSGKYSCQIKDKNSSAQLKVKEVIILDDLKDQTCFQGDPVTLTCEVKQENIEGIWSKDGNELKPSESINITVEGRIHKLEFKSVTTYDSGKYSCQIKDKNSSAQLIVKEVIILDYLKDQTCFQGDPVTLTCEVKQENIEGIWSKDGNELKPSESINITVEGRIHKLEFKSVTANDSGKYSCQIKDKNSSAQLIVKEVIIIEELKDQTCFHGDPVTLTCEVKQENIEGIWSKDGNELKPSESINKRVEGRIHKLVFKSVTTYDSGKYSCQIKDKNSSAQLIVKEVIISEELKDQTCFHGDPVTLTCEVKQENIEGIWSKDGKELKPSESINITVDGRIHKLVFKSVTTYDSGKYSCQIKDKNSSAQLTVNEAIIIKQLEDQYCTEGDSVTFTCEVNQVNIEGKWSKDGKELKPSESINITVDGRIHKLVLKSVTDGDSGDSGNYTCQIKDKKSFLHLTVSEVSISKPFEEQQQYFEGDKVTFTCEVSSEVLPGKWFKNGQELSVSDNLDIITKGKIREIVIHRVTFNDRGYYSFKIKEDKPTGVLLVVLDKITPDKINYIRLYHLLETVAEPVVRKIFDSEIHPNQLRKILNQNSLKLHSLKLQKHINIREYDLLYPLVAEYSVKFKIKNYDCKRIHQNKEEELKLKAEIECAVLDLYSNVKGDHKVTVVAFEPGSLIVVLKLESTSDEKNLKKILKTAVDKGNVGSFETKSTGFRFIRLGNVQAVSTDFDIRLMMVLMKNLTELNIADVFPHENDLTVVADLSRIKYLRNRIVQNSDRSIKDEDFAKDWKHLSEAVERLGGSAYKKKCEELKNLNPTLQHVQEYLTSENLQSNQGQTSNDSLRDFFLENEVNNLFARDAVRQIFDKQFPPQKLAKEIESRKKELAALKEERKITQSQWDDLFPSVKESLSSSVFDIKVMIILLSSTSFKDKDVFKAIENLQNHISKPEYDDKAIKMAIKEINEVA
ncbi:obscurin-like protein 1 [Mytilus galloprovincialis]|uniref:obscurin-like protein 1 n=1 Tax=Mytilus galloprovincialis TaxID=29158 RepID=UPI003F7B86FB